MKFKEISTELKVSIDGEGVYKIIKLKKGSKSIAIIEDIEMGEGYCHKTRKYQGIKYYKGNDTTPCGWSRGENYCLGKRSEVHISKLIKFDSSSFPKPKRDYNGHAFAIDYKMQYESP